MKISLIFPRLKSETCADPPLGLMYIASYLKGKFNSEIDIDILDTALVRNISGVTSYLERKKPDVVGIYFSTAAYNYGVKISQLTKDMGADIIAGGPHVTVLPESLINEVDTLVIGEGEITFTEIINAYIRKEPLEAVKGIWFKDDGKVIKNVDRHPISDLDILSFPLRDMLDMERYIDNCQYFDSIDMKLRSTTMIASRGCPFRCSYCQPTLNRLFGRNLRLRTPHNIVSEAKYLRDRYSIEAIFFHDDTLTLDREWIKDFCQRIILECPGLIWGCNTRANLIDEGLIDLMYKAGLRCLHIGAESANQRIIDNIYHKDITLVDVGKLVKASKRRNIRTMCFFMLGAPTETKQEISQTIKFARRLTLDEAVFNITCPLPGTYLYDNINKLGFSISSDWSSFNYYSNRSYNDGKLSFWQLRFFQFQAILFFYLSPYRLKYIFRHFTSFKGMYKLLLKIKRFL